MDWRELIESYPDLSAEIQALSKLPGFAEGAEPPGWDELIESFPDDSDAIAEDLRKHIAEGGFAPAPDWARGLQAVAIKAPPGGLTRENAARYSEGVRRIYQTAWDITEARPDNRYQRPAPGFTPLDGAETRPGDKRGTVALVEVGGRVFTGANTSVWLTDRQTGGKRFNKEYGRLLRNVFELPEYATSPAWHAELQALTRAFFFTEGALPKRLTLYTDREACEDCKRFLPRFLEHFAVDHLDVASTDTGHVTAIRREGLGPE